MKILGHETILSALTRAVSGDHLHHAYLFEGRAGIGKRRVAELLAAMMNCRGEAKAALPCATCRSCKKILTRGETGLAPVHPDIVFLEPDGRQIKIEQIRDLIRVIPYPPIEARFRVVIIDPADRMGVAAANALLKTLEEPPSRTRFILVSAKADSLPITIRSRCQKIHFNSLSTDQVLAGLKLAMPHLGQEADPSTDLSRLAAMADGSIGTAASLLQNPVMLRRRELIKRLVQLSEGDARDAFDFAAELQDLKDSLPTLFDVLRRALRDALLLKETPNPRDLTNTDLRDELATFASQHSTASLIYRIQLLEDTTQAIERRNLNLKLALEHFLLNFARPPGTESARVSCL